MSTTTALVKMNTFPSEHSCNEIQLKQNTKPISVFKQTMAIAQKRVTEIQKRDIDI